MHIGWSNMHESYTKRKYVKSIEKKKFQLLSSLYDYSLSLSLSLSPLVTSKV
jgi:hypothetical protein